jgi:hypothetical protein
MHQESYPFLIINATVHKVILGLPWLQCHDPTISRSRMKITDWATECLRTCFPFPCGFALVESPVVALQHSISEVHQDL